MKTKIVATIDHAFHFSLHSYSLYLGSKGYEVVQLPAITSHIPYLRELRLTAQNSHLLMQKKSLIARWAWNQTSVHLCGCVGVGMVGVGMYDGRLKRQWHDYGEIKIHACIRVQRSHSTSIVPSPGVLLYWPDMTCRISQWPQIYVSPADNPHNEEHHQ